MNKKYTKTQDPVYTVNFEELTFIIYTKSYVFISYNAKIKVDILFNITIINIIFTIICTQTFGLIIGCVA